MSTLVRRSFAPLRGAHALLVMCIIILVHSARRHGTMPTMMVSLLGKHPPTRVSANPVDARIGAYIRGYYDLSRGLSPPLLPWSVSIIIIDTVLRGVTRIIRAEGRSCQASSSHRKFVISGGRRRAPGPADRGLAPALDVCIVRHTCIKVYRVSLHRKILISKGQCHSTVT